MTKWKCQLSTLLKGKTEARGKRECSAEQKEHLFPLKVEGKNRKT